MNSVHGKLSTLTAINNIGHGFFECREIQKAAMYICVQTAKVIPFERSIVCSGNKILAVSGQNEISRTSSLKYEIKRLYQSIRKNDTSSGILPNMQILHIPLKCPVSGITWDWYIELQEPDTFKAAAELFGKHFSEGLLHLYSQKNIFTYIKPILTFPLIIFIGFIFACVYIDLPEKIIAPVIVKAQNSAEARSAIEGLVLNCLSEGTAVSKGDILAELDVSESEYLLTEVEKKIIELQIKLNKAVNDSLTDSSRLLDVQLLKIEQEKLDIRASFLKEKISRNKVLAPISGVVRYLPKISIKGGSNKGRFLSTGESLCFIDDQSKRSVEISIAEDEIHLLKNMNDLHIYYHSSHDSYVASKIIYVPERPQVNELTSRYVYPVLAESTESIGVTGTAHLRGENVKLWYYLFKKAYLYLRGF